LTAEEKEEAVVRPAERQGEDVVELTNKVTRLALNLEEERLQRKKAEEDLLEFKGFVLEQHDLEFMPAVRQTAFFYQVPVDEGKFNNRKDIYQGELVSTMDVPDEEDEEDGSNAQAGGDQSAPEVILSD